MRYIEFLEEERVKSDRNMELLGALDKVDSRLSIIAAKTERLNYLRVSSNDDK